MPFLFCSIAEWEAVKLCFDADRQANRNIKFNFFLLYSKERNFIPLCLSFDVSVWLERNHETLLPHFQRKSKLNIHSMKYMTQFIMACKNSKNTCVLVNEKREQANWSKSYVSLHRKLFVNLSNESMKFLWMSVRLFFRHIGPLSTMFLS
jgi:hypothetical protein